MKKALLLAISAVLASAAVALAQDDTSAKSVNAVGVIKYTIPAKGGFACISLPMHPLDTTSTNGYWVWGETSLASQLDIGSTVYFWDSQNVRWANYPKRVNGTWATTAAKREIAPGEAIFVQSAATNNTDKIISLLGELPTEGSLSYSVTGNNSLDSRTVQMYPLQITNFTQTALASNLPPGSTVYFWDTPNSRWANYSKKIVGGSWPANLKTKELNVGEGVFVQSVGTSSTEVTITRPFDWEE